MHLVHGEIILQLEAEKDELYQRKGAVELEKFGLREELVRVEQEKMDLDNEKSGKVLLH